MDNLRDLHRKAGPYWDVYRLAMLDYAACLWGGTLTPDTVGDSIVAEIRSAEQQQFTRRSKMAGWSIIASGKAKATEVIQVLEQGLENLKALPGAQNVTTDLASGPGGWSLSASGDGETPDDHALVLSHVQGLVSNPAAETGTSEINGPFLAAQNFHAPLPPPPAADPGAPATATGAPG